MLNSSWAVSAAYKSVPTSVTTTLYVPTSTGLESSKIQLSETNW